MLERCVSVKMKCSIIVNDVLDELIHENLRLNRELLFANKCLKVLIELKKQLIEKLTQEKIDQHYKVLFPSDISKFMQLERQYCQLVEDKVVIDLEADTEQSDNGERDDGKDNKEEVLQDRENETDHEDVVMNDSEEDENDEEENNYEGNDEDKEDEKEENEEEVIPGSCDDDSYCGNDGCQEFCSCSSCGSTTETMSIEPEEQLANNDGLKRRMTRSWKKANPLKLRSDMRKNKEIDSSATEEDCEQTDSGNSTATDGQLKEETISKERRFVCEVEGCGKVFKSEVYFYYHKQMHSKMELSEPLVISEASEKSEPLEPSEPSEPSELPVSTEPSLITTKSSTGKLYVCQHKGCLKSFKTMLGVRCHQGKAHKDWSYKIKW